MLMTLEIEELRARLQDAEEALSAIHCGEVDALVISDAEGDQIYTLRGADYQYRMLIEEMNEGAVIIDELGTITYCNKRFAQMLQAPLEKVIGSSFFLFVPELRKEEFSQLLEHGKSGNSRSEFMLATITGDRVPVYLAFSGLKIVGLSGTCMVATDLTEQKRNEEILAEKRATAEALLHAQTALYQTLLQAQSDIGLGMVLLDNDRHTFVNDAYCALTGYSREELLALPSISLLIPPDKREAYINRTPAIRSAEQSEGHIETTIISKDEQYIDVDVSAKVLELNGRAVTMVIVRDITERKKAEQTIHESEQRLFQILEAMPIGVFVTDSTGKGYFANQFAEKMLGKGIDPNARQEDLAVTYSTYIANTQELYPVEQMPLVRALTGEHSMADNMELERPDGRLLMEVRGAPVYDAGGKIVYAVTAFSDITLRKRDEVVIRELAGIVESSSDAMLSCSPDGTILAWNSGAERLYGHSRLEAVGKTISIIVPPDLMDHMKGLLDRIKNGEGFPHMEVERVKKDGTRFPVELTLSPTRASDGTVVGYSTIARDITERKQAEVALANIAHRLEQSNQELERFAFAASHDLQEPLRKIQAFASRLRDKYAQQLGTDALDSLDYILDAANRLEAMIKGVLALSRVASRGQPFERVSLGEMAQEVLADLELRIEKTGAHVEIGDLPTIDADPQQVHQLLQNLIGNALKFHKGDVAPLVRVTSEAFEFQNSEHYRTTGQLTTNNLMRLSESGRVPMFRVTVQDNGIGFDEKFLDRIFMPFQRLHTASEYEGTGMGLAICRKIVERHNGTMTATSTPGSGAKFVITLPSRSSAGGTSR